MEEQYVYTQEEEEVELPEHMTVDLRECGRDFWKRIKEGLYFPVFFGNNWDAFWDSLAVECPARKVTIIGANTLPAVYTTCEGVPYEQMLRKLLQKNKEERERYHHEFEYEFIDA